MADLNSPVFEIIYDAIQRDGSIKEVTCKFLSNTDNVEDTKKSFENLFNHHTKNITVKSITLL